MAKRPCYLTIGFLTVIFFMCAVSAKADNAQQIFIRVAVAKEAPSVKILVAGKFRVINFITKETLLEEEYLPAADITSADKGLKLGEMAVNADAIAIEPIGGARVYLNDRIFRGEIRAIKTGKGLLVVNTAGLEEYLYGVVRNEVSTWWPMEAIKAQVIAARTYALYQIKESKAKDYDVTSDVSSQVYGGIFSEKWRTNRAVDLTRGKVLTYKGAIFPTYFHATCGGGTLDAVYLWKIDLPPLKGVRCDWCKKSPHYSWERWIPLKEAGSKLDKAGYPVGNITGFEVLKRDPSGRILEIQVKGSDSTVNLSAKDFRLIIGPDILRSTNFKVAIVGEYVAFEGLGWGHGVGLCQWGAYYMSRAGKKADEILNFYYPGSKITENYGTKGAE